MLSFLTWNIARVTTIVVMAENVGEFMNRPERAASAMSTLPPKADIADAMTNVRFVPTADI
jgi:hypothetical protein